MRRRGPRPISEALAGLTRDATPQTLLARVQACWTEAVGPVIAAEAQPVGERSGTLTVACRSATWANELELLAGDLLDKLNDALGESAQPPLSAIRAKVTKLP
jgi:predicted nucleic acid-binding Zn ribbon protein